MNNDVQNKLFHYEAPPPQGAWEKIADTLDAGEGFAGRLAAYEAEPPLNTWRRLDALLNEEATPAKVIPFLVRYKNPLRYVAAASVIAVALVTITLTMRKTEAGSLAGTQKNLPPRAVPQKPGSETIVTIDKTQTAPTVIKSGVVSEEKNLLATVKRTLAHIQPQNILPRLSLTKQFIPRHANEESVANFTASDDFMVYSSDDGTAMKLPKKLFALVNCGDGDGSCKERIQSLRQKLTANVASSDFTGMLDLVRQLQ